MKKQSAFVSIPTLPKTFSGQWMTFSHMANHYRKLLSVKPRVDTGVPKNTFTSISSVSAKQSSKQLKGFSNNGSGGGGGGGNGHLSKIGTGTGVYRERPSTTGTMEKVPSRTKTKSSRPKMASRMLDYEYHALSNGLMNSPNGSFNAGSSSDGYQVVFGPSSIKSSVDAMISDPDPDPEILVEPKLSSISIGEKIRKFLDHIHAQETQQQQQTQSQHKIGGRPLLGSRERRDPSIMVGSHTSREQLLAESSRHGHGTGTGRHSKCFTPFEVPGNKGTKKRSVKSASASSHQPQQQQLPRSPRPQQPLRSIESRKNFNNINNVAKDNNNKDSPTKLSTLIRNHKKLSKNSASHKVKSPFQEMLTSLKQSANNHISDNNNNNNNSSGYNSIKKLSKIKSSAMSPTLSPRSVSVGTIRGSDELTEDFLLPGSSAIGIGRNMSTSTIQIDTGDMPTDWLKERVERGVVRINNAYFSLAPGTSTSSLGISSSMHPNKDSSRDSAYGFSSGESRITTRESTPEKKSNNNSNNSNKISIKGYSHPRHNHHHHHHNRGSSSPGTHPNGTGTGPGNGPGTGYSSTSESTHNHNHHGNNNGKYKSSLSTVASSINQDRSSSNSHSHGHGVDLDLDVHSSGHSSAASPASEKSIRHPFPQRPTPSYEELLREQKYMEFLTGVTDDIVVRGIYTNKGIKNIFKSHLMKSNELEMDKMLCLLERLRIDMGVPKDDSLNQLDFGYGSVDYSAGPYFYNANGHPQDLSNTNTNVKSASSSSSSSSPHHHKEELGVERPASGAVTTTTTTAEGRDRDRSRNRGPADPVDVDIESGGTDSEEPQLVSLAGVGQSSRIRKLSYTIERDDNNESVDFCSSELNIT